jgi:hypothetical protein
MNLLEEDLADRQSFLQSDFQRTDVPDLKPNRRPEEFRVIELFAETGVNGGRGDMDAETDASQTALPLNASTDP